MCKSFYLILVCIFSTYLLLFMEENFLFYFDLNSFTEFHFIITLLIDKSSLIFISTVSSVSSMIVMYSFYYLEKENPHMKKKFLLTLIVFIISMFILSLSANLFWLMIGWDGLGISSFCLIIFYQNWKSFGSGMVTFLSNRMGDSLIILSMVWIILNQSSNSWTFPESVMLISFLIMIGAYSKSAQFPYLFWLPQAMAAPTPVSALVHSSTLVTAGIYVMCRFQPTSNYFTLMFFFVISCITVLIAGTSSLFEFDLKKVIALSTLCHISLMMMFSVVKEIELSLFHLMTHAFFKSLLFMIAGFIIHMNYNSQDIRYISISKMDLTISFPFFLSIMSMIGFPFLSGFYSKEELLVKSTFNIPSIMMISMFLINSFFSCAYSARLSVFIFSKTKIKLTIWSKSPIGNILIIGSIFSSFLGGLIMPFTISEENEMVQSSVVKILLVIFSISGILLGMMISTKKDSKMIDSLSELWKSKFSYKIFQKHFFLSSWMMMWLMDEKGVSKMIYSNMVNKYHEMSNLTSELFMSEPFYVIKLFHFVIMLSAFWIF